MRTDWKALRLKSFVENLKYKNHVWWYIRLHISAQSLTLTIPTQLSQPFWLFTKDYSPNASENTSFSEKYSFSPDQLKYCSVIIIDEDHL